MTRHIYWGVAWAVLGAGAGLFDAFHLIGLARDPQYGWASGFREPAWWYTQLMFIPFFVACFMAGLGVLRQRRWGLYLLRGVAPLAFLYLLAYDIFGGERPWWLALIALVLTVFAGVSVIYAFRKPVQFAT